VGNLSEKQLFLALIGVVVVVAGMFGVLAFLDYQKIQEKRVEMETIRTETRAHTAKIVKIPTLSKSVEDLRKRFDRNQEKLPPEAFQPELLRGIKYQATNAEVEMTNFEIKPRGRLVRGAGQKAYDEIEVSLRVRGSFFQIAKFINRLEYYRRILTLQKGSFRVSGAGDKRDLVEFSATIVAYLQKPGSVKKPPPPGNRVWQSVDIPPKMRIDHRLRDPFKMMLKEIVVGPGDAKEPTHEVEGDTEAQKKLAEFKGRLTQFKLDFKTGAKTPPVLLETYEKLKKDVLSVKFKLPKFRNIHDKIQREVDAMEKPVRQRYVSYLLVRARGVIEEMKALADHGDFRDTLELFIKLMSDFGGIAIPPMIRNDIAMGGRIFNDVLAKLIRLSDPKIVIKAVDDLEKAIKKTILIAETEALLTQAIEYREMGRSIQEFKSFQILVSGIIWTPSEKRRIAIVNGKGYLEGARISVSTSDKKMHEVKLASVGRNKYVHFQYKGLNIRVKLGKNRTTGK
jgi:Tfp pilus assembly protein PilO